MEQKKVLSEEITYENGLRKSVAVIETLSTLADDRMRLANYYNTLAALEGSIQRLEETMPTDEMQRQLVNNDIQRMRSEMLIIKEAIEIQQRYVEEQEKYAI